MSFCTSLAVLLLLAFTNFVASQTCLDQDPTPVCDNSTDLFTTWCHIQNPFVVPHLYSEVYEDRWEAQIKCESEDLEAFCTSATFNSFAQASISNGSLDGAPDIEELYSAQRFATFGFIDGSVLITDFNTQEPMFKFSLDGPESPVVFGSTSSIRYSMSDYELNSESNSTISLQSDAFVSVGSKHSVRLFSLNHSGEQINCPVEWKLRNLFPNMEHTDLAFQSIVLFPERAFEVAYFALMGGNSHNEYEIKFYEVYPCVDNESTILGKDWTYSIEVPSDLQGNLTFQVFEHSGGFSESQILSSPAKHSRFLLKLQDDKTINIFELDLADREIAFTRNTSATQHYFTCGQDERIDNSLIFGDRLREIDFEETEASNCSTIVGLSSQTLWITLGLSDLKMGKSWLEMFGLPEFGEYNFPASAPMEGNAIYTRELSAVLNPLLGSDLKECSNAEEEWFSLRKNECLKRPRYFLGHLSSPAKDLVERWHSVIPGLFEWIEDISKLSSLDPSMVCSQLENIADPALYHQCMHVIQQEIELLESMAPTGCAVLEFISSTIQQNPFTQVYHTIFASTERSVEIFAAEPQICKFMEMNIDFMNTVTFGGPLVHFDVTLNSQHIISAIQQPKFSLVSRDRLAAICHRLRQDPSNLFLEAFTSLCNVESNFDPKLPISSNMFVFYTSLCPPATLCPDLNEFLFGMVDPGFFTIKPILPKPCPPGFYCFLGVRMTCVPGMYCPGYGNVWPKPCIATGDHNTSCFQEGLDRPSICPPGAICPVPYDIPILTPPGTFTLASGPRNTLQSCQLGDYCPLGQSSTSDVPDHAIDILCPNNTYCTAPDIIEPVICPCSSSNCSWCPAGTVELGLCEAGYRCFSPSSREPCTSSQWCPEGTVIPQTCPDGFYCPTPADLVECPSGHFCKEGSTFPRNCPPLSICRKGSSEETFGFFGPLVVLLILILLYVPYYIHQQVTRRRRAKRDKDREARYLEEELRIVQEGKQNISFFEEDLKRRAPLLISTKLPFVVDIEFENLGLILKKNKRKKLLAGVTGRLEHGKVTAVMGPSGAGKTTFLTTLAGKASYGIQTGKIYINGYEDSITKFKKLVGFVPQEDIMHRKLTVYENLLYSARLRLEASKKKSNIREEVMQVIKLLGLDDVKYEQIGDESKRGISGGQRKRVNIGMELVADPTILFLDEPTSGLDSSSSREVCMALRLIAERGLTIATVIHQPRYEIFTMFHNVLLLGKGGQTVYLGPSEQAINYFQKIGFTCPPRTNPADFFMDVISGNVARLNDPTFKPEDLFSLWNTHQLEFNSGGQRYFPSPRSERASEVSTMPIEFQESDEVGEGNPLQMKNLKKKLFSSKALGGKDCNGKTLQQRKTPTLLWQFLIFVERAILQQFRGITSLFLDLCLIFVVGLFIGLVFSRSQFMGPADQLLVEEIPIQEVRERLLLPFDDPLIAMACFCALAVSLTGVTSSMKVFGYEKVVYWREAAGGTSTLAYFIGKNVAHVPVIIISPAIYLAVYYTIVAPRATLIEMYLILLLINFAASSVGYFFSVLMEPVLGQLAGVVFILVSTAFSGLRPFLSEIAELFPPVRWVPYLSLVRWGQEVLYLSEIKSWEKLYDLEPALKLYSYSHDNYAISIGVIASFGILFRLGAFLVLLFKDRSKKK